MKSITSLAASVALLICLNVHAQDYAQEPLKIEAIEPTQALVQSVYINNWLVSNHTRMTDGQTKGVREHLHALIDARVKQLYLKNGVLFPSTPDTELASLYFWAGRLGVYGADSVFAALKGTFPFEAAPGPKPPAGLSIQLQENSQLISSDAGKWQVSVPFHFFVYRMQATPGRDSQPVEVIVISTGSAPDKAPPGYSQGTLLVLFKPGADAKAFEAEWANNFQIPMNIKPARAGDTRYQSRVAYDAATRLHKEMVLVPSQKGGFVISYSGLDGTYQANRPHFLDVLRLLKI